MRVPISEERCGCVYPAASRSPKWGGDAATLQRHWVHKAGRRCGDITPTIVDSPKQLGDAAAQLLLYSIPKVGRCDVRAGVPNGGGRWPFSGV